MNKHKKKIGKRRTFFYIEEKLENVLKSRTAKMLVDFCTHSQLKNFDQIKISTRFLSGKMFILAKLSLMNFIYALVETISFPNEKVKKIYDKYLIEKVYIYHVLTDTDSTCLQFMFLSDPKSDICEKNLGI